MRVLYSCILLVFAVVMSALAANGSKTTSLSSLTEGDEDLPCYRGSTSNSSLHSCGMLLQAGIFLSIYKGDTPPLNTLPAGCLKGAVLSADGKIHGGIYKGGDSNVEPISCGAPSILTPDETLTGLYKGSVSTLPAISCLDAPTLLNYIYPVFQGGRSYTSISCGEPIAMGRKVDVYRGGSSTITALGCSNAGTSLTDGASMFKGGISKAMAVACKTVADENPNAANLYGGGIARSNRLACADASSSLGNVLGCYNGGASKQQPLSCFTDPCIELKPATITASGTIPICKGKTLTLTGSEATTYEWLRADTPTGTWTKYGTSKSVEVKESGYFKLIIYGTKGCSKESKIFFAEFNDGLPKPTIDIGGSSTICLGGSVPLTTSKAFKYSWSTGATSAAIEASVAGTYQVTVEDENGCVATSEPIEIKQASLPSPTSIIMPEGATEFCMGSAVRLTSVDAAYYRWSNGSTSKSIDATQSGTYTVRIGDANGCEATSAPVSVIVHNLEPKVLASSTTICYGKPVALSVMPAGARVEWYKDGALVPLAGANINVSQAGIYAAQVTNAFGCVFTSNKVTVISNGTLTPLASISSSRSTLCQGGAVTLTAPDAASYQWSTLDTKREISIMKPGDYAVTVTDGFGCPSSASITVKEVPVTIKPSVIASRSTKLCPGESLSLTVSEGNAYAWNTGQTDKTIQVSSAGVYKATVYDTNGCDVQTPTIEVSVYPEKKPTVEPMGKTILCAGDALELRTLNAMAYEWSTGAKTPSITVTKAGDYSAIITDENGCRFSTAPLAVQQYTGEIPPATISSSQPVVDDKIYICPDDEVTLEANEAAEYRWSTGESTRTIKVSKPGKYSVALTYGSTCTSVSKEVEVLIRSRKPMITVDGRTAICPGEKLTLELDHGSSFVWNSGQHTQKIEIDKAGTYFATVIDEYGCTLASDAVDVTMFEVTKPTVTLSGKDMLCTNESVVLNASNSTAYQWSTGEVSQSITVKDAGSYSITTTDANGCTATSSSVTIDKHPVRNPVIEVAGGLTICQGEELTLAAPSEGTTFLWNNGATTSTIPVKEETKFGSFSYSVAVTYPEGCTYTSPEVYIKVNRNPNKPEIFSVGSNDICPDPSIALIATQSDGYNYEWSTGAKTFGIVANKLGNYWVKVADKLTGCSSRSDEMVVDKLISAKVTIDPSGPINICDVGSIKLSSSIQNATEYRWSSGEKTSSITVNQPGYYKVTVTNEKGCSQTSEYVEVRSGAQIPEPTITADGSTTFCEGSSVKLSCTLSKNYQWRRDGIDIATANLKSLEVTQSGSYTVVVSDKTGCKKESRPVVIKVNPLPKPTIMPSGKVPICPSSTVTLTSSEAVSYQWSNGKTDRQITVDTPGQTFTVAVVDANGCSAQSPAVEVVVATQKAPAPSVSTKPVCQGERATLTATSTIDNPIFTWYTTADGGTAIATSSQLQTEALSTNTTYWVAVHNLTQCQSNRTQVEVTVKTKPSITFNLPASTCSSGSTIALVATPEGGTFSGTGVTANTFDPKGLSGAIRLTYTLDDGCISTSTKKIQVDNISVNLKSSAAGMVEPGTSITFTATSSAADCTYEFFVNGSSVQAAGKSNTFTSDALINGDELKVRTVNTTTGCWAEDALQANIRQPISWEEPSGNIACAKGQTVFKVTKYDGYSYSWKLSDPIAGGVSATGNPSEMIVTWTDNSYFAKGVIMVELDVIVEFTLPSGKKGSLSKRVKFYRRPETGAVYGMKNQQ